MTPWTLDDLHDALTRQGALPTTNPPTLTVVSIFSEPSHGGRTSLVFHIDAGTGPERQRWRLMLEGGWTDLAQEQSTIESAALIVRANIEEWWTLKDIEPDAGWLAVRLGP